MSKSLMRSSMYAGGGDSSFSPAEIARKHIFDELAEKKHWEMKSFNLFYRHLQPTSFRLISLSFPSSWRPASETIIQ